MANVFERTETVTRVTGYTLELSDEEAGNLHALLYRGVGGGTLRDLNLYDLSKKLEGARGNRAPGELGMFNTTACIF